MSISLIGGAAWFNPARHLRGNFYPRVQRRRYEAAGLIPIGGCDAGSEAHESSQRGLAGSGSRPSAACRGPLAAVAAPGHHQDGGRAGAIRIGAPALTIPAGTDIPVTIDENVALKRDQVGNTFPAHVTRNVVVNGAVAIPAGAPAEVVLVESDETPGAASFRVARISIGGAMRPVRTDVARADATRSGLSTGKKPGIGALAGGVYRHRDRRRQRPSQGRRRGSGWRAGLGTPRQGHHR